MTSSARAMIGSARTAILATSPRDRKVLWGVAAGVAALVAVVAAAVLLTGGPVATGSVVIDAIPWGTVTAIEDEGGELQPLPTDPSTPLSLTLPLGAYKVTVAGPPPESRSEQVSVRVEAGVPVIAPLVRFRVVTPEEYFAPYLVSPTSPITDESGPEAPGEPAAPEAPPPAAPAEGGQ